MREVFVTLYSHLFKDLLHAGLAFWVLPEVASCCEVPLVVSHALVALPQSANYVGVHVNKVDQFVC